MNLREAKAGAPIYRGRMSAIIWLWLAGVFIGDMDIGLVWPFVPSAQQGRRDLTGSTIYWEIDLALLAVSLFCLAMGVFALDRYGRNAWFAWAPDDAEWSGMRRGDVNRLPRGWGTRLYGWRQRFIHRRDRERQTL